MRRVLGSVLLVAATLGLQAQTESLKVVIIEGDGAVNLVRNKTAIAPIVEVRDRNNLPVPGAVVTFSLAGSKTAVFAASSETLTITTNAAGRAAVPVLTPVAAGEVQIAVSASYEGHTASAVITQTNAASATEAAAAGGVTTKPPSSSGRSMAKIAGIAGVAGGVAAATLAVKAGTPESTVPATPLSISTTPARVSGIRDVTQFSFSAQGGSVLIPSYGWDFGDGFTASGQTVTRTFPGEGLYTVTLRMIGAGQTEIASVNVRVASLTATWAQRISNATLRLVITQQGRNLTGLWIVQGDPGSPSSSSPLTGTVNSDRTVTISQGGECLRTMTLTANSDVGALTGSASAAASGCESANGPASFTRQ